MGGLLRDELMFFPATPNDKSDEQDKAYETGWIKVINAAQDLLTALHSGAARYS
jgi:hypothetical protein